MVLLLVVNCSMKTLESVAKSLAPDAQDLVLAPGCHRAAVWAPVHCENLISMPGQVQLQLPGGHVPHLDATGHAAAIAVAQQPCTDEGSKRATSVQ